MAERTSVFARHNVRAKYPLWMAPALQEQIDGLALVGADFCPAC